MTTTMRIRIAPTTDLTDDTTVTVDIDADGAIVLAATTARTAASPTTDAPTATPPLSEMTSVVDRWAIVERRRRNND